MTATVAKLLHSGNEHLRRRLGTTRGLSQTEFEIADVTRPTMGSDQTLCQLGSIEF